MKLFVALRRPFSGIGFGTKYALFTSSVIVLSVVVTATVCLWNTWGDMHRQKDAALDGRMNVFWALASEKDKGVDATAKAEAGKTFFVLEDGQLKISYYAINDNHELVDKMSQFFKGTASIFMKDTLLSTSTKTAEGARPIGTRLVDKAFATVIKDGKPYRGDAVVAGVRSFTAYEPVKNPQGEVVGALMVAVPRADYFGSFLRTLLSALAAAVFLISAIGALTFIYTSKAMQPLQQGVEMARRLADGDLTATADTARTDEFGRLIEAMRNMVEKWRSVVVSVKQAAGGVSSAGTQAASSAEQMSRGAELQAERAAQVATASEELSQTVTEVAQNANGISAASSGTVDTARNGQKIVSQAVQEVRDMAATVNNSAAFVKSLGDRSQQIGAIIGVINDIADQTNLLALNAAIEAARAGEQGRGFAVVADEVRKLAERTSQATSEISDMIRAIREEVEEAVRAMGLVTAKVDTGVRLTEEAGGALFAIVKSVDELQVMVQQIASATEQMSSTSGQISRDIEQIALVARDTSSSSQETARASSELARLSRDLEGMVQGFTL